MQNAGTVLDVLRERGRRGLPLDELYRQLFNPQLYLLAYGRIYSNKGAMTPGATGETADGMSLGKIGRIIDALRHERYRWSPAKRIYIPKKNGKQRPLGLPPWSDKLVGEVVRLLLEAYYEPSFSGRSHGFRPGRGCHTALREVASTWTGTTWFIEGDVADCFGSLDHQIMLSTLAEKIHDNRFLRLMRNMLKAGYLEDWVWNATLSGVPQGGVVSPVMSNIYLHRLDEYVETVLIPEYTRGRIRKQQVKDHQGTADPVISVDTKKKELVGEFKNAGREWRPQGQSTAVRAHDFPEEGLGKAVPYGVYDITADAGWVSVGTDHDTAAFAVESIRRWWKAAGRNDYPQARRLLITADAGGSNGYRIRAWKAELAALAVETGMEITCCHFRLARPNGTRWSTGCSPTSR